MKTNLMPFAARPDARLRSDSFIFRLVPLFQFEETQR